MSSEPCFRKSEGGILKISGRAMHTMAAYAEDESQKTEAGGILLGRFIIDSHNVVVDRATVPMPGDIREPRRFVRRAKGHQQAIDRAWTRSQHRSNYLGRWHTHIAEIPCASPTDRRDWERALRTEQFDSSTLFFVIVAAGGVCVWEGESETCQLVKLGRARK